MIFTAFLVRFFQWRTKIARVNSRRIYSDFENSRHCDIADVLKMFKFHRDIGVICFTEKIASQIAVNIARVKEPLVARASTKYAFSQFS